MRKNITGTFSAQLSRFGLRFEISFSYWCDISKIMEGWMLMENGHPRYLMREHRPMPIKCQSDAIYKCREDHAVASMM